MTPSLLDQIYFRTRNPLLIENIIPGSVRACHHRLPAWNYFLDLTIPDFIQFRKFEDLDLIQRCNAFFERSGVHPVGSLPLRSGGEE